MQDTKEFHRAIASRGRTLLNLEAQDVSFALPKGWDLTIVVDREWGNRASVSVGGTRVFKIEESYGTVEFHDELGTAATEERMAKLRAMAMRLIVTAEAVVATRSAETSSSNAALDALDAFEPEALTPAQTVPAVWAAGSVEAVLDGAFETGPCRSRADAISQMYDGHILVGMSATGEVLTYAVLEDDRVVELLSGLDGVRALKRREEDPAPI